MNFYKFHLPLYKISYILEFRKETGWPFIHGRVFMVKFTVYTKVAYTLQVTFYKFQETHGHVYLVGLP